MRRSPVRIRSGPLSLVPLMLIDKDNVDIEKMSFASKIQSEIVALDFQRDRVLQQNAAQLASGVRPTHDADFYMVLLRRLYRRIEDVQHDSRVANLKGEFYDLYKKIKIRDHFEHEVDLNKFPQYAPGIFVIGGLVINGSQSHIVSGNKKWFLVEDHNRFKNLLAYFIRLYPFAEKRI